MPDDMLEEVIQVAKKALDEHEFEEEGVEVSSVFISKTVTDLNFFFNSSDCAHCKTTHGRALGTLLARIPRKELRLPRSTRTQPFCVLHL